MGTSLMKDGELVVAYNMLAAKLGKPTVKKFPDNETAMRRYMELKKMTDTTTTEAPTKADAIKIAKAARAKATGKKAPAKKAAKKAAKKKAAKKASTKKAGSGDGRGRTSQFSGKKLYPMGDAKNENPRRKDTNGWKSMEVIRKNPGITYEDWKAKGLRLPDLIWDVNLGRVSAR